VDADTHVHRHSYLDFRTQDDGFENTWVAGSQTAATWGQAADQPQLQELAAMLRHSLDVQRDQVSHVTVTCCDCDHGQVSDVTVTMDKSLM
jgi:hypothetical protein